MSQILADRLSQTRFFEGMPPHVLHRLADLAVEVEYPAGSIIFREGEIASDIFVLEWGHVSLDMNVPGRRRVPILTLGPGDLLGWSAARGERPMTAAAVAMDEVRTFRFPATDLLALCDQDHEIGYFFYRQLSVALSRRLLATRLQLLDVFAEATDSWTP
ncbi:MAG: cyclic nucleotide-binding domain-containing protein [Planctomycetaceae bacterium]|nr:cyclic nucleotide-binding domain-containing protein [Planctomycetaceae bacterium]